MRYSSRSISTKKYLDMKTIRGTWLVGQRLSTHVASRIASRPSKRSLCTVHRSLDGNNIYIFTDKEYISVSDSYAGLSNSTDFGTPRNEYVSTFMNRTLKLIVFDLDLTLWPLHVDSCATPFLKKNSTIFDSNGHECNLYPEVKTILNFLRTNNYTLAAASRAKNICGSFQLLHFLEIADYFRYKEIYPGTKKQHFRNIISKSNLSFSEIAFFDNDKRNIKDVKTLGVHCFLVDQEITLDFIRSRLNI